MYGHIVIQLYCVAMFIEKIFLIMYAKMCYKPYSLYKIQKNVSTFTHHFFCIATLLVKYILYFCKKKTATNCPMKKQRGLKRYYRNLAIQNDFEKWEQFDFVKNSDNWFDLWHCHFDWKGLGNLSFKRRKPHIKVPKWMRR